MSLSHKPGAAFGAKLAELRVELLAFLLFSLAALLAASFYVGGERFFYISDFNFYHYACISTWELWATKAWIVPLFLYFSTKMTHNLLFTALPSLLMVLGGPGRVSYIVSLMASFTLPYLLALALVLRQTVPSEQKRTRTVLWLMTLLAVALLPVFFVPVLRGYPDNLAALPSIIAVFLYLKAERKLSTRLCVKIGLLLAFAPLVRRHYFYSDIACLLALFIDQVLFHRGSGLKLDKQAALVFKHFALIGLSMVGFLATFGILFLQQVVFAANYSTLYRSAATPAAECMGYFFTAFSIPVVLMALAGFAMALGDKRFDHAGVRFLAIYSLSLALIWPLLGTHVAQHYLLYWMPLVVFGNSLFLFQIVEAVKLRWLMAPILALGAVNLMLGYMPYETLREKLPFRIARFGMLRTPLARGDALSLAFSPAYGPLRRNDFEEVHRLVEYLRTNVSKHGKVFAGVSWDAAEADALRNAERYFYGRNQQNLKLLNQPYADSSESYPLERMLNAEYILMATPVFYLYSKPGEYLADVFVDVFEGGWPFSRDFQCLPQDYKLDGGYTLKLYKRLRPTPPAVAVTTLKRMADFVPNVPGGQPIWLNTDNCCETVGESKRDYFTFRPDGAVLKTGEKSEPPGHYLLSSKVYQGEVTVSAAASLPETDEYRDAALSLAEAQKRLTGLPHQAVLACYGEDGSLLTTAQSDFQFPGTFKLSTRLDKPAYLVLSLRRGEKEALFLDQIELKSLKIEAH